MLKLLSKAFEFFVDRRNKAFDRGDKILYYPKAPLISIGNLSAGGGGKTPLAIYISKELIRLGLKPAIIGRGYKKTKKGEVVVCDGISIISNPRECGDEMYLCAKNLNIPVIANEKKYLAAQAMDDKFKPDCIILDDGFQHRYVARDLDILLIDEDLIKNPQVFPAGRLREPITSIRRADMLCFPEPFKSYRKDFEKFGIPSFNIKTQESGIFEVFTNSRIEVLPEKIISFCGLAKPIKFENSLNKFFSNFAKPIVFRDHHTYSEADINKLIAKAKSQSIHHLITTEKDAVKLTEFSDIFHKEKLNLLYLKIDSFVEDDSDLFFELIISTIKKKNRNDGISKCNFKKS
jgi:tetraacyldisaccharide 4'-kinase